MELRLIPNPIWTDKRLRHIHCYWERYFSEPRETEAVFNSRLGSGLVDDNTRAFYEIVENGEHLGDLVIRNTSFGNEIDICVFDALENGERMRDGIANEVLRQFLDDQSCNYVPLNAVILPSEVKCRIALWLYRNGFRPTNPEGNIISCEQFINLLAQRDQKVYMRLS